MKVAWFTPFSRRSAIGEYSTHVASALADSCDVELWVATEDSRRKTDLPVRDFAASPRLLNHLPEYELVVYNMGDHLGFHGAIYDVSRKYPGVVVLHDRIAHNLLFSYWLARGRTDEYVALMEAFYGARGRRIAEESFAGRRKPVWESDEELLAFPLFEEVLVGARGVVVHSPSHADAVRERWWGPVGSLFLPAYRPAGRRPASLPSRLSRDPSRVSLLTVGHVNRNKQVDTVIRALGSDHTLAEAVRYFVVGPYDPGSPYWAHLQDLVREHDLDETVELIGYQPDDVLLALMQDADVFLNLRYPSLEGASASLMQELSLGAPVVVAATGSFAELPDDCVVKVPPRDEKALVSALRSLVFDQGLRQRLGREALRFTESHSPERFAAEFLAFHEEVRSWSPVLQLCDAVASELGVMAVDGLPLPVVDFVASEIATLAPPKAELESAPSTAARAELRDIEPADHAALARFFSRNNVPAVVATFDPFPLTEETARRIAVDPRRDRYYGAFIGDRLVALSMLRGWDEGFELPSFGIVVDRTLQGQGLGSRLTDWTIEQARRLGSAAIRLSVYGSNRAAHAMYAARGFRELSREPVERDGRRDERIVMLKELGDSERPHALR